MISKCVTLKNLSNMWWRRGTKVSKASILEYPSLCKIEPIQKRAADIVALAKHKDRNYY